MDIDKELGNKILELLLSLNTQYPTMSLVAKLTEAGHYVRPSHFNRVMKHLESEGYAETVSPVAGETGFPTVSSITVKGRKFIIEGGYSPTGFQKIVRWLKGDSGYGNIKWLIAITISLISLYISLKKAN